MSEVSQYPKAVAAPAALLTCALAAMLAGCGKSEKIPTTAERLASVQQKQETQPDFYIPRKTVDYMGDLKSLKDAPASAPAAPPTVTAPAAPRTAEPARAPDPVKPAETRPAPQETKTAAAAAPEPAKPAVTPVAAPPSPAAPANNVVASAAPSARPAAPQESPAAINVISRAQPEFPREALRQGIESGTVRARLTISANGEVTNVAILQAQPARVFDRSVQTALRKWRFNPGADNRSYDTEVGFKAN